MMRIKTARIEHLLNKQEMEWWFEETGKPYVTLSWAQTLDGCLTLNQGESVPISCATSMELTHQIRSWHDGILVGIGTALADNPRLTARLNHGNCDQPRPVVLDSRLRIPSDLRLFDHPLKPIIAATHQTNGTAASRINGSAEVIKLPATSEGQVEIEPLLGSLGDRGIKSLMVEGGGQVLTSFLNSGCINKIIITIAPVLAGGYDAVHPLREKSWAGLPRLENMQSLTCGSDIVVSGDFKA